MQTEIIKIGNSQGIRIPKKIIEQCGIKNSIKLEVKDNIIILTPTNEVRKGWAEKFKALEQRKEDEEIFEFANIHNNFDDEEWEW